MTGNAAGRIGSFAGGGGFDGFDRRVRGDAAEAESSRLFYGARGPNSYQAGHLRRQNQQQQAARLSSFYDSHYSNRSADTISNAPPTPAPARAKPENWDRRTAAIAALFGRGPGADGGRGISIGMENRNDDSTMLQVEIPARRIRYVNNAKAPPMP